MKKISSCPPPSFHTPIFASAYDPWPLKASAGLLHTTDLCSQSRRFNPRQGGRKQTSVRREQLTEGNLHHYIRFTSIFGYMKHAVSFIGL